MQHNINAHIRIKDKKSTLKKLRIDGFIPAVVYGNNKTPTSIYLNEREFRKEFSHISESILINLNIQDDTTRNVLIKDFKQDFVRGTIIHIDFLEIEAGKKVSTKVGLNLQGTPTGIRQGGILEHFLHEVEIECLPKDLPERLDVDISELDVSDALHISDLPQLSGVTFKHPEDQVVLQISVPKRVSLDPDVGEIEDEDTEETDDE